MTKLAVVGEAWGQHEEEQGQPFVGPSGRLLNSFLSAAGISRHECLVSNVFNLRPKPSNDIMNLCGPKDEGIPGYPALIKGKYVHAKYHKEVLRLYDELRSAKPTLILALGATACWALLRQTGIKNLRGTPIQSPFGKVFPTYHPAALMREYKLRPIFFADLHKARKELEFPEIRRPQRSIWIEPCLTDMARFEVEHINPSPNLSIDIETIGNQIKCIGFSPRPDISLVVPFFDTSKPDWNYWPSHATEVAAWEWVKRICALRKRVVGQNFLYDAHFLWRQYGIAVPSMTDDLMLCHHAHQIELPKDLGFLGSIYSSEQSWKLMRRKSTIKKED